MLQTSGALTDYQGVDVKQYNPQSQRCTIQRTNGEFCDMPDSRLTKYPLCRHHAATIWLELNHIANTALMGGMSGPQFVKSIAREDEIRRKKFEAQSVVYYVRIHDHIKIGFSTNVKARMSSLRVSVDNVLATEPGGRELESKRHKQFAHLRIGQKENFKPAMDLIHHIDAVVEFHGPPKITSYVGAR